MHFGTFPPLLADNFAEFCDHMKETSVRIVDSYKEALGKEIIL
jgi:hypothetical protein